MKKDREHLTLYLVTDRRWLEDEKLDLVVERAIKSGVTMVQLREKELEVEEFVALAKSIKKVTDKYNIPFVINDNIEVVKAVDADGVHLGQEDMDPRKARDILGKEKIVGVSVGNLLEAERAEKAGADYLGVGALFETASKSDAKPVEKEVLGEIVRATGIPIVGIGGIGLENMEELKGIDISGVAVISAILKEKDIETSTRKLYEKSREVFYEGSDI